MTPQQIEALKLALEALQFALHVGFDESSESQIKKGDKAGQQHRKAITAIKEALADHAMREVQRLGQEIEQAPAAITNEMAFAFHSALTDGAIGEGEVEEIKAGLAAAFAHITTPPQRTEQNPVMMEIFWGGEEAGVRLTQEFIDSHKVLQLDVLIDAKAEIERIYEELLRAKE